MQRFFDKIGNLKRGIQIFLVILCFILFLSLILASISLITNQNYFLRENLAKNLDELINILVLASSLTAFVSIFFTLEQSRRDRKNELQQTTIDLFKELRSERFRNITNNAWDIRQKWSSGDNKFKKKLIKAMFSEKPNQKLGITADHIQSIYDLVGFYTVLSLYRGNEDFIRDLNYFYYGWWRNFLYDLSEFKDGQRISDLFELNEYNNIEFRQEYIANVSFSTALNRLDNLCGFENVPKTLEFHKSGG
ncbi:hypothetical protein SAMN05444483_101417 [Salegentibacter echinorum]|uniref:Phage abortive infection protein n=1 Tax=Salegentibacter echinorum TaxID=1073325 RepID=A0A1M5CAY8_SALEC|nr:hypothetical protein [Salegentibacter echinorum]SHF51582.1 hypothetical protein SAMN05444483_101417 [Salegentibacter echinorum]